MFAVGDYWLLIRPRIIALVLFGMLVAAWTAAPDVPTWWEAFHGLLGTASVITGAIAMNQWLERHGDALMPRTAGRPLPSGRLAGRQVLRFAVATTVAGLAYLAVWSNSWVVALAVFSWAVYVTVYTPLKSSTPWQTPIGAVAGAMPMLLGAAVAGAPWTPTAWTLFAIVFFWQFPHAMAIAWLYRDQFARGEVKLATVLDPSGRQAAVIAVVGAAVLLPLGAIPRWTVPTGWGYAICALSLGTGYLAVSAAFFFHRNDRTARRLLRASLVYLTGLFVALLLS